MMLTRRAWLASFAASQAASAAARVESSAVVELEWSHLPSGAARRLAVDLGLKEANWAAWREERARTLARRITEGSAEHLVYYVLQSRAFTEAAPLLPVQLAHEAPQTMPDAAAERARQFQASFEAPPPGARHAAIVKLARSMEREQWTIERSYRHTMAFLRAKEVARSAPLERLYFERGLSSDTSAASLAVFDSLTVSPRRVLLAGPGLDLTRREKWDDALPLKSHQFEYLRQRYPKAVIDTIDVRPEVIETLGARRADLTTSFLNGGYDLVAATNVLLYFEDRELLTSLAGFARALAPGGLLLHNDTRFAAKVFGDALGLPVEKFAPRQLASKNGIQQWDRAVIHRKAAATGK